MLRGIHKASSTWLGRGIMAVIMGGLVVSFAIWGIGDIFRGFGANSALKIGSTEISTEQFRQFYTDRLQQISRQAGRPITPDQARAMGIDRQVLSQLVAETTLDEQTKALGLGISNDEIASRITGDAAFKGVNGQFDRTRFAAIIRDAGYTEARFVDEQRRVTLRRQIALSISGDLRVPATGIEAINQYQNEKRAIEYLSLGPAQAGDIPQPTPEQLSKYFEERKVVFRAPEYRKITLLSMSPADLAKPDAVSDADAKTYYELHKSSYGTPERRELRQIIFPKPEEADAAHERIVKGASFDDIVKERDLKSSDVVASAFATDVGVDNEPLQLQNGGFLWYDISGITPSRERTLDEVKDQVTAHLRDDEIAKRLQAKTDDMLGKLKAGTKLAQLATESGLKVETATELQRGKPGGFAPAKMVEAAFKTPKSVPASAAGDQETARYVFDVTDVTDPKPDPASAAYKQITTSLQNAYADDLVGAYVTKLESDFGVTINQQALIQVIGGAQP